MELIEAMMQYGLSKKEKNVVHYLIRYECLHLDDFFTIASTSKNYGYQVIKKLEKKNILERDNLHKKALWITQKERKKLCVEKKSIRTEPTRHTLICTQVIAELIRRGLSMELISIEKSLGHKESSVRPDIAIKLNCGNYVAIEVELNQKDKRRVDRKIQKYKDLTSVKKLIYLCEGGAIRYLISRNTCPSFAISLPIDPMTKSCAAIVNIVGSKNEQ